MATKDVERPVVWIDNRTYNLMSYWAYLGGERSQEITCFGLTEVKNGEIVISGAHLIDQEGTGGSVDGDDDAIVALMMELDAEGISPEAMRCWVHSHPGAGESATYLSGTDEANIERWLTGEFLVSIVFDCKGGSPYTRIDMKNPRISIVADLEIIFLDHDDLEWAKKEFKDKVRKKTYIGTGFQGSPYSGSHGRGHDGIYWHQGKRGYWDKGNFIELENGMTRVYDSVKKEYVQKVWNPKTKSYTEAPSSSSSSSSSSGSKEDSETSSKSSSSKSEEKGGNGGKGKGSKGKKGQKGSSNKGSQRSVTSQGPSSTKGSNVVEIRAHDGDEGNEESRPGWLMQGWPEQEEPEHRQQTWDNLANLAARGEVVDDEESEGGRAGIPSPVLEDDTDPTQLDLSELNALAEQFGEALQLDETDIEIVQNINQMERFFNQKIDEIAMKVQMGHVTDIQQAIDEIASMGISEAQAWAELEMRLTA